MSPTQEHPDRRTFLLLGAGVGAAGILSACTLNNPFSSAKTPAADAVHDLAPDVAIAVRAVGLLRGADANRAATVAAYPKLGVPLDGLSKLYQAHLAALTAAVPDGIDTAPASPPRQVPATQRGAQRMVMKDAQGLHTKLIGLAVAAESGPFARLLGSMAAALSQQGVVLTGNVPR